MQHLINTNTIKGLATFLALTMAAVFYGFAGVRDLNVSLDGGKR